jgi:putative sigma-54 modulation protein
MLRRVKSDIRANNVCGMRLVIPGNDMLSHAQCKTFEATIAQAVDALKRQIEKRKSKVIARRM